MKFESDTKCVKTTWIKDFKNSVMCPSCAQQFNWENYEQSQDEFIYENRKCPICGYINVWYDDENARKEVEEDS